MFVMLRAIKINFAITCLVSRDPGNRGAVVPANRDLIFPCIIAFAASTSLI